MLVRNLTQGGLIAKGVTGKKIILPPLKVVEIDGLEFPAERLKKLFGRYIHILTEKVEEPKDDVSTEPKEDVESKKGNGDVPTADETATEEEKDKDTSVEDNDTNANTEDTNNDSDDVDELVDSVLEEIESEDSGEEKVAPKEAEKKPAKSSKKNTKKTSKK